MGHVNVVDMNQTMQTTHGIFSRLQSEKSREGQLARAVHIESKSADDMSGVSINGCASAASAKKDRQCKSRAAGLQRRERS